MAIRLDATFCLQDLLNTCPMCWDKNTSPVADPSKLGPNDKYLNRKIKRALT
jgi:hypothetical protein